MKKLFQILQKFCIPELIILTGTEQYKGTYIKYEIAKILVRIAVGLSYVIGFGMGLLMAWLY